MVNSSQPLRHAYSITSVSSSRFPETEPKRQFRAIFGKFLYFFYIVLRIHDKEVRLLRFLGKRSPLGQDWLFSFLVETLEGAMYCQLPSIDGQKDPECSQREGGRGDAA